MPSPAISAPAKPLSPAASSARFAEAPELEAPSPTFTLMQVYDAPRGPVVHADFYRLRGPTELANLGWDEAIDGAIAIVEWPEKVAEALPADRLEVDIRFDASRGPDFRLLRLRGFGAIAPRLALALGVAQAARARRLERREARIPAGRRVRSRL